MNEGQRRLLDRAARHAHGVIVRRGQVCSASARQLVRLTDDDVSELERAGLVRRSDDPAVYLLTLEGRRVGSQIRGADPPPVPRSA